MKELLRLYGVFFKIGICLFGGGYSMLPLLQREIVDKYHWATQDEILNYFAIGQCTPGIIAVNTATFIGYKRKKTAGAIVATLGIVTPSLIIITIIAALFENFSENETVQHAFAGIRVAAGALIAAAVIKLIKSNVRNPMQILLCIAAFVMVAVLGQSAVFAVIGSAVFGVAYGLLRGEKT